ncbi:MAG TPA: glucodextranase DOMON-like domain-containing protein, partial [Bacteroidota bacterium]|nr:glucodextranase DOMON-like domain-containing protein [Bacteroidota bacterium]
FPLLGHGDIMRMNPGARLLIDRTGADTLPYTYPRNAAFLPGSFALRRFTLSVDSAWAYFSLVFRALSDPGWHPEYGFQLTFAAIAIDRDGIPGSGRRRVGRNASYVIDSAHAYERIIYVGGGIQLEDHRGTILAAYRPIPADAARPFGDAASGTIRFAVPLALLGTPSPGWTFTVLAGAQDDHGGSGLGEFRTVNAAQGEWNGGGKSAPGDPNVYGALVAHYGETR